MSFALLALLCAVAMLGPIVSLNKMLRVPVVIGELAIGMILGRSGLAVVDSGDPILSFMAEVGFALVMFVAGTHVPIAQPAMLGGLRNGVLRAVGVGLLAVPLGWGLATWSGTGHGALYAVLIASSSAGIVMPSLAGVTVSGRTVSLMTPPALDTWEIDPGWDGTIFRSAVQSRRPNRSEDIPIKMETPVAPTNVCVRAVTVDGHLIQLNVQPVANPPHRGQ